MASWACIAFSRLGEMGMRVPGRLDVPVPPAVGPVAA